MTNTISLTIDWRDADSDMPEEQQEVLTQTLFQELRALDEVEDVKRIADPDVPDGGMGANWLWSVLTAEITVEGIKQVCQDVYERLPGKPIEFRGRKRVLGPRMSARITLMRRSQNWLQQRRN